MGTFLAIYSEKRRKFYPCADKRALTTEGMRRLLASPLRYCLGGNYFYIPAAVDGISESDRLCWVRDQEFFDLASLNRAATDGFNFKESAVRIGNTYTLRRREMGGKFLEVQSFISKELYEAVRDNPEVMGGLSKDDFESLCAEVFVRRGFEVDLFRKSGDGGIDFLAIKNEDIDTLIFAVQCKHPDERPGRPKRTLGRPVLQQVYGAAKAWDLHGAIAISGSTYSPQATRFAQNKPQEMFLYDADDIIKWMARYRWNQDE